MKKKLFIPFLVILTSVFALTLSCDEDPQESCEEEEICDGKDVIACCTSDSDGDITCVYKYNGKEYKESEIDDLADDLGCTSSISKTYKEDIAQIVTSLENLMDKVRCVKDQN